MSAAAPATAPEPTAAKSRPAPDPFDELTRPRRPWWLLFILLIAAGAGGYYYYRRRNPPAQAPRYLTTRVSVGDITETIEATGQVKPLVEVQVSSQVSGRVVRVAVDFNSRVRAGELLAELDPVPFRLAVAQNRASLMSAQASLNRARADLQLQERNLARAEELRSRGLNAQADVDTARGARDAARAQIGVVQADIARSRATLQIAETNLGFTRIVAPIDGIVITRSVDPGQTVAASLQAPTLFVIANDLTRMRVLADIDEADIGKLHEGMEAEARVDAFPNETFRGVVRELRFASTNNSGVISYPAVIDVPNPEIKLRPGMTARIVITTAQRTNVLRVPNAALRFRPSDANGAGAGRNGRNGRDGGGGPGGGTGGGGGRGAGNWPRAMGDGGVAAVGDGGAGSASNGGPGNGNGGPGNRGRVFVLRGGRAVMVRVEVGITDGYYTEVRSDELRDGTEVITDETDAATPARTGAGGAGGGGSRGGSPPRRMF